MEKQHGREEFELRMQHYDSCTYTQAEEDATIDNPTSTGSSSSTLSPSQQRRRIATRDQSPERSVMGPLDQDAVSMDDAISNFAASPTRNGLSPRGPRMTRHNQQDDSNSTNAAEDKGFWDTLLDLAEFDWESKRIIKLALPFATQALSTCLLYTSPSPRDQRGSRMPSSA